MKKSRNQNPAPIAFYSAACLTAALCAASPAAAAEGSSDSRVSIRQPVAMNKTADLLFGDFTAGKTNSVFRINPRSGALSQRSGDAISLGGTRSVATIEVSGTALLRVQISTGTNSVLIQRDGGAGAMRINRFRFDRRRKALDATGKQSFNIGGQLRIGANQTPGTYRGSFDVSVDYF